jgi:hypothetical protein
MRRHKTLWFKQSLVCWFSQADGSFQVKSLIKSALKCITKVYNRSSSGYSTGSKVFLLQFIKIIWVGISVIVLNRTPIIIVVLVLQLCSMDSLFR